MFSVQISTEVFRAKHIKMKKKSYIPGFDSFFSILLKFEKSFDFTTLNLPHEDPCKTWKTCKIRREREREEPSG